MISKQQDRFSLPPTYLWLLSFVSFFLVAFGQPAFSPFSGLLAAALGFALFFLVLLNFPTAKHRFYIASVWFGAVQLVQLSWFISHPFWYIYAVYLFLAIAIGVQFGIIAIFIKKEIFFETRFSSILKNFLPLAALWTILEWSRLFAFSGLSWNPIGLAMAGNLYSLQSASLAGVYALSFWVMMVNLLALWAWVQRKIMPTTIWLIAAAFPYLYGITQVVHHDSEEKDITNFNALLVQTAFSPEESQNFSPQNDLIHHVIGEWGKILEATKKHRGKNIDLIVLPEFVVPYGTYSDVYPLLQVMKTFYEILGPDSLSSLPDLDHPFMSLQKTQNGLQILVNNAYWTQALANFFHSDVIIGLEDVEDVASGYREYYSSAIFIHPQETGAPFYAERYTKRVLVPMGEYIPFETCRKIAQSYGVFGSFTCGKEAVVMNSNGVRFSPSICYEETYGNIIREGRQQGADLFVNLTSDVWFPNSKLPKQHLEHARLRTVENGVPLIRACNTGVTAAIDSMGRNISILGGDRPEEVEWVSDSLLVNVPIYSYTTLYSKYGDFLIIGFSSFVLLLTCLIGIKKKR